MKNKLIILQGYFRYSKSEANNVVNLAKANEVAVNPYYVSRIEPQRLAPLETTQSHSSDNACNVFFGPNQYVLVNGTVDELVAILRK